MRNFQDKVELIWSLANLLRGDYKPHEYADVILPLVVLRRMDQAMEPTRDVVRRAYLQYKGKLDNLDSVLEGKAGGSPVYNYTEFNWARLLAAPNDLNQNFIAYINGFSPEVQDIIEKFDFRRQIERLQAANLLYLLIKEFSNVDLHPDRVDNYEMGSIFEELIRRFSEQYNETAGEHFTPREVIELMVDLLLSEHPERFLGPDKIVEIYDPACGTGGMLSEGKKGVIRNYGQPPQHVFLFGQEINPTSYAVAKADLLLKGENPRNLAFGNSFSEDGFPGKHFRLMLSNPPFGVEWKKVQRIIKSEHETLGFDGRFGAGLPRITDGSFLFLQHMLAKRFEDETGSRIAIIFNGSPLFTGDAGSGESEIRRWILENDWLEGIVALPEQMFYNTGIATYIWIVTNRKSRRRKGRVQLIDASGFWEPMRPRSLGNKRRYISPEQRQRIVALYKAMKPGEYCRIFDNADFGYRRIRVERPLRLNFQVTPERIARLKEQKAFRKLTETRKRDPQAKEAARRAGEKCQQAILEALHTLPTRMSKDPAEYQRWVAGIMGGNVGPVRGMVEPVQCTVEPVQCNGSTTAILNALTERDETAKPVPGKPDPQLRDYERVPLKEDVYAYFEREVKPYVKDAWIDEKYRDKRDHGVGVVGYEINFNRYFYKYTPPPHPEELARLIEEKEREIAELIREGQKHRK